MQFMIESLFIMCSIQQWFPFTKTIGMCYYHHQDEESD
jgi:hypothetical protein